MDGSAAFFGGLVKKVGLGQQTTLIQAIIIDIPLTVCEHHKHAGPLPADECSVDMSINDPVIGRESMDITVNEEVFSQQLVTARTPAADSGIAEHCLKIY